MDKRERLEHAVAGDAVDRVPVMLCRHWPGDDQRAADLARATLAFQQAYDWDCVVLTSSAHYNVLGYGVQESWQGDPSGCTAIVRRPVQRSLDWTELRGLDPARGDLGKALEALRLVLDELGEAGPPVLFTIYSPLAQAARVAGHDLLLRNLRTHPDRLRTGLNTITESTLRLVDALRRTTVAGVLFVVDQADYGVLAEAEYEAFGLPYDLKILEALGPRLWLNLVRMTGTTPMLNLLSDYPVQGFGWPDAHERPTLEKGRALFDGLACGGLDAHLHMNLGTPNDVREAVRRAVVATGGRRLLLTTGDVMPVTVPQSNMRALREAVEKKR